MSYIQPTKSLLELFRDLLNLNKTANYVLSLRENSWNAPENVFIPTKVWTEILQIEEEQEALGISLFAALVAWRYSQGIYHFDEELLNSLVSAGLDNSLTLDRLASLPEYCVYISLPEKFLETLPDTTGALAYHDFNFSTKQLVLRFELFTDQHALGSIVLPLEEGVSIQEGMEKATAVIKSHLQQNGKLDTGVDILSLYSRDLPKLLPLVLHLCSDRLVAVDKGHPGKSPCRAKPKKVKGGVSFFPPQQVTVWKVGKKED